MRYGSVCSGIEAASAAWHPLGWKAAWFSEIESFPCSVLKHHYPDVPNLGDMTKWETWPDDPIDILVGGTPCQSFSVAGKRGGMDDHRGRLALAFSAIACRYKPRWIVWENVPGVLSSGQGRDFGSFLGSLAELGYGCAYRVLDAQHFGVAQRRRRVFVVGHLGDWRRAAAVLFEREGLRRDPAKGGKARQEVAGTLGSRATAGGGFSTDFDLAGGLQVANRRVVPTLDASYGSKQGVSNQDLNHGCGHLICMSTGQGGAEIAHGRSPTLTCNHEAPILAHAFTAADARRTGTIHLHEQAPTLTSQTKRGDTEPCVLAFEPGVMSRGGGHVYKEISGTIRSQPGDNRMAVAIGTDCYNGALTGDIAATIGTPGSSVNASGPTVMQAMQVRRLTPRECERLQGFPDDYTNVPHRGKPAADGPRYKALGNSMAVPVMAWIGERIQMVEDLVHA